MPATSQKLDRAGETSWTVGKGFRHQNMLLWFDVGTLCLRSSACIQEAETFEGFILRVEERTDGRG